MNNLIRRETGRGDRPCRAGVAVLMAAIAGAPASLVFGGDHSATDWPVLRLRTGDVRTSAVTSALTAATFDDSRRYVLALDGPLSPTRSGVLTGAGVRVEDYLGDQFVLVSFTGATPAGVKGTGMVVWAGPYDRAWKIDPDVLRAPGLAPAGGAFRTAERVAWETGGARVLRVILFDGEPAEPVTNAVRAVPGARVMDLDTIGRASVVVALVPAASVPALADVPQVRFVEEFPEFLTRDVTTRWVVQSNVTNSTPLYDHGLSGQGQILGLIDSKVDVNHCSFVDPVNPIGPLHRKILAYNTALGAELHGTHVAGIVVGDDGTTGDLRGIAYNSRFVFNTYPSATESSFVARFTLHNSQGAFIHSNSWGASTTAYDGSCRGIDIYSWDNDDNLVLFAIDHTGVVKNPENAKNCLGVAASGDAPNQEFHCDGALGPTADGRRRPEIMGPGCGIVSAKNGSACGIDIESGTSMATPAVAGAGILLRQYFTEGFYPSGVANAADAFVPTGPMLKAALINSAVDVTGITGFPSDREGWGRVLADNVAYFAGDARKLVVAQVKNNTPAALTTGKSVVRRVRVNSSAQSLKVTMAFHDAPGAVNSAAPVVNDLDLAVSDPADTAYLGNVFAAGVSTTGGAPDAKNNVEQVLVAAPMPGVYRVVISAPAVNVGQQGYGLVVTGDVTELCPADFDGDGFVTGDDYDAYVNAFTAGDASADFDGDGFVTGDDFDAYVTAFEAGC